MEAGDARTVLLTIDDGPSPVTSRIVAYLSRHRIPAIMFFRGDRMEEHPAAVLEAIRHGFVVGNHLYRHARASQVPLAETLADLERTEGLIDRAYEAAGVRRPARYLRFPQMDCGLGGWIVDYDALDDREHRKILEEIFTGGLNVTSEAPDAEKRRIHRALADYLAAHGFAKGFCPQVPPAWFRHLAGERNFPFTFSTADWKLTERHRGRHADTRTVEDIVARIDADSELNRPGAGSILLIHDQVDLYPVFERLMDHFRQRGFGFAPVA